MRRTNEYGIMFDKCFFLSFKPPSGYQSANFSDDLLETFANDAVSKKSGKQVWCIKLPDGVRMQDENGGS